VNSISGSQIKLYRIQTHRRLQLSHMLHLKRDYDVLVDKYSCVVQETYTVQDPPAPPSDILLLPPLTILNTVNPPFQELPQPWNSRRFCPSRSGTRFDELPQSHDQHTVYSEKKKYFFSRARLLRILLLWIIHDTHSAAYTTRSCMLCIKRLLILNGGSIEALLRLY
jgi:hypothetical protein